MDKYENMFQVKAELLAIKLYGKNFEMLDNDHKACLLTLAELDCFDKLQIKE